MSKCASNCGQELGFLRSGICPDCVRDIAAMQKGVARLRQMNPPWEYRPTRHYEDGAGDPCTDWERAYFSFVTHDGDKARGGIEYIDHWAHHCF